MSLCALCRALTISNLYPPSIYNHGKNLAALELSGRSCQLCKLIHWSIARASEGDTHPQLSFEGAVDEVTPYGEHETRNQCSIKLQIVAETWDALLETRESTNEIRHIGIWMMSKHMVADITLAVEEGTSSLHVSSRLGLTTKPGDELGARTVTVNGTNKHIAGRVFASTQPTEAYFGLAKRWFDQCLSSHATCQDGLDCILELPTRVIDVGFDGQTPRLVDGKGKRARYATLSHCWGRSPTIKTELESLRSRQESIPLENLPKTFAHAVIMCRALGIQYLWIDSLCIIQDDKGDWEHHSHGEYAQYARNRPLTWTDLISHGLDILQQHCDARGDQRTRFLGRSFRSQQTQSRIPMARHNSSSSVLRRRAWSSLRRGTQLGSLSLTNIGRAHRCSTEQRLGDARESTLATISSLHEGSDGVGVFAMRTQPGWHF